MPSIKSPDFRDEICTIHNCPRRACPNDCKESNTAFSDGYHEKKMKESLDTSQIMMDELTQASALIAQAIDLINRGDLNNAWQLFSKVSSLGLRVELNANRLETTLRLAAEEGKNKGA